jgi:hypothetical protein
LNTNNQYRIFSAETLPYQGKRQGLDIYESIFLDLGFRTSTSTAGIITPQEQGALASYINTGKPTMIEGNDFGSMYDTTLLFTFYHVEYKGDGAPFDSGNIDTLYGTAQMFASGETLKYNYRTLVDNYVDSIIPLDARLVLVSAGAPTEWYAGRTGGWSNSWKQPGNTIYNTFMLSSIKSISHPHTYAEYFRRCLGFLRLNCQPEPITTLNAVSGATEGCVAISWQVVSDDSLAESAEGPYKLKFARKKMTSEAAFADSSEEYYQNWNTADSVVGAWMTQNLYGLPPMDTLIFALKVSDERALWDALGAEPRAVVAGDSLTPHILTVGDNFVKDFSNNFEFLDLRNTDSLFVTWDGFNFYVGFARCNFRIEGDLFVYVDTKIGGADSTVDYNGPSGRSWFTSDFRPDYVFILEDDNSISLKKYTNSKMRGSWVDTVFTGIYSEDSIVNELFYTEISIPFNNMGYTPPGVFKLVVLVQNETTNNISNAFPITNPLGSGVFIPDFYHWGSGLASGLVPNKSYIIGIEEKETYIPASKAQGFSLQISPNPFKKEIDIRFQIADNSQRNHLKIYDVSGRLVRQFDHQTIRLSDRVVWDGTDASGSYLGEGIYFCEFKSGEKCAIEKIILVR